MRSNKHIPHDVPFSLTCAECDAGTEIASFEEAAAAGWTEIDYAPDLPMANFVGLCPQCWELAEHWPTSDTDD